MSAFINTFWKTLDLHLTYFPLMQLLMLNELSLKRIYNGTTFIVL